MTKKKGRVAFQEAIEMYKIKGELTLKETSFKDVVKMLLIILDKVYIYIYIK